MDLKDIPLNKLKGTIVVDEDGTQGIVTRIMFDSLDHYALVEWMGKEPVWHRWEGSALEVHQKDPLYEVD